MSDERQVRFSTEQSSGIRAAVKRVTPRRMRKRISKTFRKSLELIRSGKERETTTSLSTPSSLTPGSFLDREWEIIKAEDLRRRLSFAALADIANFSLPGGSEESEILSDDQTRQIISILPARAEGYPWSMIYSSTLNGFSLATLYRTMLDWDVELSPVLVLIETTEAELFGAVVSGPLHVSEHFYGTGESLLFTFVDEFQDFRWTGENNFFIRGELNSLSIGAGNGASGIWLDGDLYRGRTQETETFNNPPLTLGDEDFLIAKMEAFGFKINP